MRSWILVACGVALALFSSDAGAQSTRSLIREGNSLYKNEKYSDAEISYRKALEKEDALVQGHFNLGDALHKQGKFDEAVKEYQLALSKAEQKETRSHAVYNIGNSLMRQQKYDDAAKAYIESLKLQPKDSDAKYNLSYALAKLRQQQQKKDQNKNQDKNKDKNQDKNQKDQQNNQNDQDKKQQNQDQQVKKQPSQQQKLMSKNEAERILDVLKNSEKDVQRKLRVRQAVKPKTDKDW